MYKVKKDWKEFNISLEKLSEQLTTDFPEHETNPVFEGLQACGDGEQSGEVVKGYVEIWFNKEVEGYSSDEEGNVTTEENSGARTLENLWSSINVEHAIATDYVSSSDLIGGEQRAREDAATKTWDSLSATQKKMISGVAITVNERKQLLIDFPSA